MTRLLDHLTGRRPPAAVEPERDLGDMFTSAYFAPSNGTEMIKGEFASYVVDGYQSNSIVFSVILARAMLFSEAEFKFRDNRDKRIFTTADLDILETPWPGATTGELLWRMEQDGSIAGNAFVRRTPAGWLQRLRPDLVDIISVETVDDDHQVLGYVYWADGRASGEYLYFPVDEVAHWSPVPDPLSRFRGMSWLTPVVREIRSDIAMSDHKESYFRNAASPNMLIRYPGPLTATTAEDIQTRVTARHAGPTNAWRTMVVDQGADVTLLGSNMRDAAFVDLQAAGENRIAAAGGVPGIVVGLREGLEAATYSNYAQAMRRFADLTMRPLWRSAAASLAKLVVVPAGARLWYDTTDIAALREGETERAQTASVNATAMQVLISAGYTPDSVTRAVISGDFALLTHTGLVSVQLQTPGGSPAPTPGGPA